MGTSPPENEDLIKIQTRVQSVRQSPLGLQRVFNTLKQDSAFRLVTSTESQGSFDRGQYKARVSLGISNAAATALIATLHWACRLIVTGLVVSVEQIFDAQEKAAEKARELVEIESSAVPDGQDPV